MDVEGNAKNYIEILKSGEGEMVVKRIEYIHRSYVGPDCTLQDGRPVGISVNNDDAWVLLVECPRISGDQARKRAVEFVNKCGGASHLFGTNSYSRYSPIELSFYFGVKITFAYKQKDGRYQADEADVYFGQGEDGSIWWVGSDSIFTRNTGETLNNGCDIKIGDNDENRLGGWNVINSGLFFYDSLAAKDPISDPIRRYGIYRSSVYQIDFYQLY